MECQACGNDVGSLMLIESQLLICVCCYDNCIASQQNRQVVSYESLYQKIAQYRIKKLPVSV